jgi:hypothetical protein
MMQLGIFFINQTNRNLPGFDFLYFEGRAE